MTYFFNSSISEIIWNLKFGISLILIIDYIVKNKEYFYI